MNSLFFITSKIVNVYSKISKNAGALIKGYKDNEIMQLFGKIKADKIAFKFKNKK